MALASGATVGLVYVEEVTQGVTPGSTYYTLRTTNRNINLTKNTLQSNERRSDRQIATVRHGFNQVVGSPGFELSIGAYDDMLEGATGGTWAPLTTGTVTATAAATDDSFTLSASDWYTLGFQVGDIIDVSGYEVETGNNDQWRIATIVNDKITVTNVDGTVASAIGDEAGGGNEVFALTGKQLTIGTTLYTYTFERQFSDITQYQKFAGCAVNQMSFSIQPEQIVGGTLDIIGMTADAMSGSSLDDTPEAAATAEPFSAFEGTLYEGGSEIAVVTGIDFQIANNRTLTGVVGADTSPAVFEGDCVITGTLTAFFENATLYNKFVNETASSIDLKLDDLDGTNFMRFHFGNVKYMGGDMDPPQQGPVETTMPFQALVDSDTSNSLMIQRSNV